MSRRQLRSHEGRLDRLIPIRIGRMVSSPYAFLRGVANVHATDFAGLPATGITPVICGDAHLGNFGFYASPERNLVFDLNDLDEAHPGAWEWDLRRLATSVWVAGRQNRSPESTCGQAVSRCVEEYRLEIATLAEQPLLARSYQRLDVDRMLRTTTRSGLRAEIQASERRARRRTSDRTVPRFTEEYGGARRIVEEPPLITHPGPAEADQLAEALDDMSSRCHRTGPASSAATDSSTSRTRLSGSAPSACVRGSRCVKAAARTTSCSFSSKRPDAP
jgi:hypothetical protein